MEINYQADFSYDEMFVLNNVGINVSLKDAMNSVLTQVVITRDKSVKVLLMELHAKLKQLTEEDWDGLQKFMPFEIPFLNEDLYDSNGEWSEEDKAIFNKLIEEMEKEKEGSEG